MILKFALVLFSVFGWSDIDNKMSNIKVYREDGKLTIDMSFEQETKLSQDAPILSNRTIQFDINGAQMETSSKTISLKDAWLKSVYVYNSDPETIRLRIHAKAKTGKELKELFNVSELGKKIKFQLKENTELAVKPVIMAEAKTEILPEKDKKEDIKIEEKSSSDILDKPMFQTKLTVSEEEAVETTSAESEEITSTTAMTNEENEKISLNENKESKSSVLNKKFINVAIAVSLLIGFVFGLAIFMKKWRKVSGVDKHINNIKVLSQHYLGPKKSLCVIRVAGETLLVGVTDNNINLIKALSLLDEEIPETLPRDFVKTLKEQDSEVPDGYKLTHINDVKKFISRKYADL